MKRTTILALLVLSTLGAANTLQAQQHGLKVTVPFEFKVGDKTLPADSYIVTSSTAGMITMQSDKHANRASVATQRGHDETKGNSKLVFDRYGDQYFLHSILCPTSVALNVKVPMTKEEKRVRDQEGKREWGEIALLAH
jgi:hypothetical protein